MCNTVVAVGHTHAINVAGIFVQGHRPINVKCMLSSAFCHIVDCREFM